MNVLLTPEVQVNAHEPILMSGRRQLYFFWYFFLISVRKMNKKAHIAMCEVATPGRHIQMSSQLKSKGIMHVQYRLYDATVLNEADLDYHIFPYAPRKASP